jgi:2-methylcitrate dehydratase
MARDAQFVTLPADTNQARGLAQYAIDFMWGAPGTGGEPGKAVLDRTNQFYTDACLTGISALALGCKAPTVLRNEAFEYAVAQGPLGKPLGRCKHHGATVLGSPRRVKSEKAIVANCAAAREWDSNGTNFGYNPERGHTAGEFGHNDFYAVPLAAAQMLGADGATALKGMVLHDEIRGRLAEVFSLKTYKIDHVVHGAIASAAVFGAMVGATAEQIESAIGMTVAHYIPWRAIRAGKQLSDSKGASAAISTEAAVLSLKRSMAGFQGPRDIFRNPEAIFRAFEGPGQFFGLLDKQGNLAGETNPEKKDASPFELVLARAGGDFTIMGMHIKLALYEHQSAGAVQAVCDLIAKHPHILDAADGSKMRAIKIVAYEPAFGIIGDPAKKDPKTRQSADHSMAYIIATLLRKALEHRAAGKPTDWKGLMLGPLDYNKQAVFHPLTRQIMARIDFSHGGPDYDRRYPDGIPTSVVITDDKGAALDSGLVMYPAGHARNTTADFADLFAHKCRLMGGLAFGDPGPVIARFNNLAGKSADEVQAIHDFEYQVRGGFEEF